MNPGPWDILEAIPHVIGRHGSGFLQNAQKPLMAYPLVRLQVGIGHGSFVNIVRRILSLPQLKVTSIVLPIGRVVKGKFTAGKGRPPNPVSRPPNIRLEMIFPVFQVFRSQSGLVLLRTPEMMPIAA